MIGVLNVSFWGRRDIVAEYKRNTKKERKLTLRQFS